MNTGSKPNIKKARPKIRESRCKEKCWLWQKYFVTAALISSSHIEAQQVCIFANANEWQGIKFLEYIKNLYKLIQERQPNTVK